MSDLTVDPTRVLNKENMKIFFNSLFWIAVWLTTGPTVSANDLFISGKNEIFDNPFVATGFNPTSNVLTGSISVSRTAPGETNECRILFSSNTKDQKTLQVRYFVVGAEDGVNKFSDIDKASVVHDGKNIKIKLDRKKLEAGCEWILSFVGEPSVTQQGDNVFFVFPERTPGTWRSVHTIKSKRAAFYKAPGGSPVEGTYLVPGDMIYAYEEQPDWLYVKYQGRKKMTVGWIKKADTVPF
jgi:hypothetical protein